MFYMLDAGGYTKKKRGSLRVCYWFSDSRRRIVRFSPPSFRIRPDSLFSIVRPGVVSRWGCEYSAACRDFTSCRQLVQVGVSTQFNNISWLFPHSRQNVMLLLLFLSACCFFWFFIVRESKHQQNVCRLNWSQQIIRGRPQSVKFFPLLYQTQTHQENQVCMHTKLENRWGRVRWRRRE